MFSMVEKKNIEPCSFFSYTQTPGIDWYGITDSFCSWVGIAACTEMGASEGDMVDWPKRMKKEKRTGMEGRKGSYDRHAFMTLSHILFYLP